MTTLAILLSHYTYSELTSKKPQLHVYIHCILLGFFKRSIFQTLYCALVPRAFFSSAHWKQLGMRLTINHYFAVGKLSTSVLHNLHWRGTTPTLIPDIATVIWINEGMTIALSVDPSRTNSTIAAINKNEQSWYTHYKNMKVSSTTNLHSTTLRENLLMLNIMAQMKYYIVYKKILNKLP